MSGKIRLGCEYRILSSQILAPFQLLTLQAAPELSFRVAGGKMQNILRGV